MNANYEFALPRIFIYRLPVSLASLVTIGLSSALAKHYPVIGYSIAAIAFIIIVVFNFFYFYIRHFTRLEQRLKDRDLLLQQIHWSGDEAVLDIGCGNGILILSAAKRLTSGRATGIDTWTENSGANSEATFLTNTSIEGVSDRVTIENHDARKMPYENNSFDIVLCGLTMHHILHGNNAEDAVSEMVRVLKPGGHIAIYDIPIAVATTSRMLKEKGMKINKIKSSLMIATS